MATNKYQYNQEIDWKGFTFFFNIFNSCIL